MESKAPHSHFPGCPFSSLGLNHPALRKKGLNFILAFIGLSLVLSWVLTHGTPYPSQVGGGHHII